MGFSVFSIDLQEAIRRPLKEISDGLFDRANPPQHLYHYTCRRNVAAIVESRALWATCLAEQSDMTELAHATNQIREYAALLSETCRPCIAAILLAISTEMDLRREFFYIACFCSEPGSKYHLVNYGECCLEFEPIWMGGPALGFDTTISDCWYMPIIYDEKLQSQALMDSLTAIKNALETYTQGDNKGPASHWMTSSCAIIAAAHLLALAVGFKNKAFEPEQEWRIVCCPRINPLSTAPKMADEAFAVHIRTNVRRHIELTLQTAPTYFGSRRPASPFTRVIEL